MFHRGERALYQELRRLADRGGVLPHRYSGMPFGVELADRWMFEVWDLGQPRDQERLVDNPAAPNETGFGTDWVHTQITGSTVTVVDTAFPAFLRIATPAADGQGQQLQACKGAVAHTRTLYDTLNCRHLFFSITCRIQDANNNAATMEQNQLFVGFAPVDASILTAVPNFVGLYKGDGSGTLQLVADQANVAPSAASTRKSLANLSSSGSGARSLANKWMTLSFLAADVNRTTQKGTVHGFLDHGLAAGNVEPAHSYLGSIDLDTNDDVPGANMCPSIAFLAGEAVVKNLEITKIIAGAAYRPGA